MPDDSKYEPWEPPADLSMVDSVLWRLRAVNLQGPLYHKLKDLLEAAYGESEFAETTVEGSQALGKPVRKFQRVAGDDLILNEADIIMLREMKVGL